ncbi:hypothetical protein MYX77_02210 [Acidobacteriia bacterium AH_259_A11_L15]|nr:hypothetical protein [Acidobacteriia bacterium AH_259_A11_L15]
MTFANHPRILVVALAGALALPVAAQVRQAKPIKVEQPKRQILKFEGDVLLMTRTAITVRSHKNYNLVRTFIYDEKLAKKMAELIDKDRSYQHGDRVTIEYPKGTDTAVKIDGKPRQKR